MISQCKTNYSNTIYVRPQNLTLRVNIMITLVNETLIDLFNFNKLR